MKKEIIYKQIMDILNSRDDYKEYSKILDYELSSYSRIEEMPYDEIRDIYGMVEQGGCEGIYADIYAEDVNHNKMYIITFKTLEESVVGYTMMGAIAGLATWAAHQVDWE